MLLIMSRKQSPLQRIKRIMDFNLKRGCNSERVNNVYRNILKAKYGKEEKVS